MAPTEITIPDTKEPEKEEDINFYKENIFNKEDFLLYRAVMYFYQGDSTKAI